MKILMFIVYLSIVFLGVCFALLNSDTMMLNLYWKQIKLPISVISAVTFTAGIFTGCIFMLSKQLKLKFELIKVKNQLQLAEQEVNNLRVIPIKNEH
jgi:putative membrane protein